MNEELKKAHEMIGSTKDLMDHFRSMMDECLENWNADGSIKRVEISDNGEVSFVFDVVTYEPDNFVGFWIY